jgi:carboxyl-terminal processing protease
MREYFRLKNRNKTWQPILSALLIFCLLFGSPFLAGAAENAALAEVKELINEYYVDPVSEQVLRASSIKQLLERLDDPNTQYLTKEEYSEFLGTLDRSFAGVGVEFEITDQGAKVTKVLAGYGAEKAGLKQGDIIIEADGYSLVGKSSEYVVSKLRGAAGSSVQVEVLRGTASFSFKIERMTIELPLVEGTVLDDHIGYVAIYSFGEDTAAQFDREVRALKSQQVDSWIIDLRDNGGGYTQAAFDLLGYLIGEKTAVILKDRSPETIAYRATKQAYLLEGPIIVLTNNYTASSSEITTAAIKDHNKATIIGENTYGSGRVKALLPLSNGDYLKLPINKFFSPYNQPIDKVGVAPHLDLSGLNELQAALLLLNNSGSKVDQLADKTGYIQLTAGPNSFILAGKDLRNPQNWALGQKIMAAAANNSVSLKMGGQSGWEALPEDFLTEGYRLYYPEYFLAGDLKAIPLDKKFTVTFRESIDWSSVTPDSVELIEAASGQRLKCRLAFVSDKLMTVQAESELQKATTYWLVIHPGLKDKNGGTIRGGVALAQTLK